MDLEQSAALHARVKAMIAAFDPSGFDLLACDIARYQAEHSLGLSRLCAARGIDPAQLALANAIPAVPTDAFKLSRVSTFDEGDTRAIFRTSGTTRGGEARGCHAF